jgi:DNA modification methylase|tara:strand:- start:603 stop:1523 length:921 start_codon:yes stop_codon:yes gene_type:complete
MIKLYNDDCLKVLSEIETDSVDMIFADLPYGSTKCKWDVSIPLDKLWEEYNRICKINAAMVFTAAQPFTSVLINSNIKNFKYTWVWEKSKATGYLNAKKMPMRAHEDICVFYRKPPVYNPQMVPGDPYNKGKAHRPTAVYSQQGQKIRNARRKELMGYDSESLASELITNGLSLDGTREELVESLVDLIKPLEVHVKNDTGLRYPRTVQYFKTAESEGKTTHPTQKPVALMDYFIKTYSNEGETILDNVMGTGATGVAAVRNGRSFIGVELDKGYYDVATQRILNEVAAQNALSENTSLHLVKSVV